MGQITIDEMHKSLFDYAQAVSDENLITESKTIVGAINETYGKKLIANAIGEPLNSTDTYAKMNNDINSLLSTFKTNMMNNGVTVENGDKFKQLIDKIATMVEEGSGKGIRYASEAINVLFKQDDALGGGAPFKLTLDELDFEPSIVFIETEDYDNNFIVISSTYHTDIDPGYLGVKPAPYAIINTTATSKQLYISVVLNGNKIDIDYRTSFSPLNYNLPITYYAIGVGEEDTELSGELDIISATKLPATGRENQICVITDNPDNKIVFVTNLNDIDHSTNNIYIYLGTSEANTYNTGKTYECDNGNFTFKLYIVKIYQNSKNLASYIYQNGTWVEYTYDYVYFIENSALTNSEIFGTLVSGDAMVETSDPAVYICSPSDSGGYPYHIATTNKKIDFSLYNYIEVVGYHMSSSEAITMMCYDSPRNGHYGSYVSPKHYAYSSGSFTTTSSVQIYDIRSWTSTGYLGFECITQEGNHYIYITDVRLR